MEAMSRPLPDAGGSTAPPNAARDFVTLDDSGEFSYYRSERDLLADFEYVREAACIIDRNGSSFDLALDPNRRLVLGREHGPVEFHWLRQALSDAWEIHPDKHRLRRAFPTRLGELVSGLFETLELERGSSPAPGPWTFDVGGITIRRTTLHEVDRRLADEDELDGIRVKDPLGHIYRPVRHRRHWYQPARTGFIVYEEIPGTAK